MLWWFAFPKPVPAYYCQAGKQTDWKDVKQRSLLPNWQIDVIIA